MTTIDSLSVLRDWTMSHKIPQEMTSPDNRTLLVFGDYAWPKCVKTNFKMFNTDKNLLNYYTLESIWFLLTNAKVPHSQYVKSATKISIPVIKRPDRMTLLNYLRGSKNITDTKSIDVTALLEPPIRITGGDDENEEEMAKKHEQMIAEHQEMINKQQELLKQQEEKLKKDLEEKKVKLEEEKQRLEMEKLQNQLTESEKKKQQMEKEIEEIKALAMAPVSNGFREPLKTMEIFTDTNETDYDTDIQTDVETKPFGNSFKVPRPVVKIIKSSSKKPSYPPINLNSFIKPQKITLNNDTEIETDLDLDTDILPSEIESDFETDKMTNDNLSIAGTVSSNIPQIVDTLQQRLAKGLPFDENLLKQAAELEQKVFKIPTFPPTEMSISTKLSNSIQPPSTLLHPSNHSVNSFGETEQSSIPPPPSTKSDATGDKITSKDIITSPAYSELEQMNFLNTPKTPQTPASRATSFQTVKSFTSLAQIHQQNVNLLKHERTPGTPITPYDSFTMTPTDKKTGMSPGSPLYEPPSPSGSFQTTDYSFTDTKKRKLTDENDNEIESNIFKKLTKKAKMSKDWSKSPKSPGTPGTLGGMSDMVMTPGSQISNSALNTPRLDDFGDFSKELSQIDKRKRRDKDRKKRQHLSGKDKLDDLKRQILQKNKNKKDIDPTASISNKRHYEAATSRQEQWNMDIDPMCDIEMDDEYDKKIDVGNVLNLITNREKTWQTRHSVLQVPSRSFKDVLQILDKVNTESKKDRNNRNDIHNKRPFIKNNSIRPHTQVGYSRYDQEQFKQGRIETHGFNIDINNYNKKNPLSAGSIASGSTSKGSNSLMSPSMTPATPEGLSDNARIIKNRDAFKKRPSKTPIIIIPAACTSVLTAFNAKSIFEKYLYTDSKKNRPKADAAERAGDFLIQRRKTMPNGDQIILPYRVVNNVNKLDAKDWERVVCVFVQGPRWQFKGWPWTHDGDIGDIFQKTCAFHIKFNHLSLDNNIKNWQVTIIDIDQSLRHQDGAKLRKMWDHLESWMARNKPNLRF